MDNIKFSVLMSIYCKEKPEYFSDAMESLICQTLQPDEVILVEDGELTYELDLMIEKYQSIYNKLKVIKFDKNRGLGPALNDGLKECKNELVFRMDTDDICEKDRFEKQVNFFIQHPDIDAVGTNMIEYDEQMTEVISEKKVPETTEMINIYLKTRNPINHPTIAYKKSKVLSAGSYEDYPYFEDYYLWAKMIANGCKFYNIQENLYKFRAGDSMIKRRGGGKYLSCIKKFEKGLLDLNIIDKNTYKKNVCVRYLVSIIPHDLRAWIYKKILRSDN